MVDYRSLQTHGGFWFLLFVICFWYLDISILQRDVGGSDPNSSYLIFQKNRVRVMVFNATFNNISVISCQFINRSVFE